MEADANASSALRSFLVGADGDSLADVRGDVENSELYWQFCGHFEVPHEEAFQEAVLAARAAAGDHEPVVAELQRLLEESETTELLDADLPPLRVVMDAVRANPAHFHTLATMAYGVYVGCEVADASINPRLMELFHGLRDCCCRQ